MFPNGTPSTFQRFTQDRLEARMKAIGQRTIAGSRFNVQSVVSGPVTQEYNPAQRAAGGVLRRQLIDRLPTDEENSWSVQLKNPLDELQVVAVRECLNRQRSYGHSEWQREMAETYGLGSTLRSRGRPRSEKKSSLSLRQIPERLYRSPDVERARHASSVCVAA